MRNWLFDHQIVLKSTSFDTPIVVVGNLSVGGTGKTPMVEWLLHSLSAKYNVAVLSRGYGRKTKGFRQISVKDTALTVGDEPLQMFQKFSSSVSFFVGEDRVSAIQQIERSHIPQIIILDDAFQHRYVKPDYSILLTTFYKPFYEDFLMPVGMLREARMGAKRADCCIVTKIDAAEISKLDSTQASIKKYLHKNAWTTGSYIQYDEICWHSKAPNFLESVTLVSGIANSRGFEKYCLDHFEITKHFEFSDHYNYKESDVIEIKSYLVENKSPILLTTEKDYQRLKSYFEPETDMYLGYIPIKNKIIDGEKLLKEIDTIIATKKTKL